MTGIPDPVEDFENALHAFNLAGKGTPEEAAYETAKTKLRKLAEQSWEAVGTVVLISGVTGRRHTFYHGTAIREIR